MDSCEYALQQYEDAIKLYKAGKPVDFDELPCPPGKLPLFYYLFLLLYVEHQTQPCYTAVKSVSIKCCVV